MAASLLPISGSAALNSIRVALELLLDNMAIPRFNTEGKEPWPIKLGRRIERFKNVAPLRGEHGSAAASTVFKIQPHLNADAV